MSDQTADVVELSESSKPRKLYNHWDKEIKAAGRRQRKFVKQGNKIVERFQSQSAVKDASEDTDYNTYINLFHTNAITLQSMMYGQLPTTRVEREFADPNDDVARVASMIIQRALQNTSVAPGKDLATTLETSLQDRILPGLGVARVRYEYMGEDKERSPISYTHWQDFRWGWCRTWATCPWVAFRAYLDKETATTRFGKDVADRLEYKPMEPSDDEGNQDTEMNSNVKKTAVWEIWSKRDRMVYWYCEGQQLLLDKQPDPLRLNGFFPCPRPMAANTTTTLYQPVADFVIAQDLYNQIDTLATRISIITDAVKVVGLYDAKNEDIARMFTEGVENDLIPVDNWAMLAEKGGLAGSVDWFPVQEVVGVLQTLRQVLSDTIDMLYQVTGMSDLLRGGSTDQYTSDGTNQLKAKFGSIRVQAMQDDFARFAAELATLKAEVISKHYSETSLAKQANVQFLPEADQPRIPEAMKLIFSPDFLWRVEIKPESMAMVDYAQLRDERTQFLNAMATYVQSAQAAAQSIPGSLPALLDMLKWGMAGFKGSRELEGTMDQAIEAAKKAAEQPQPDEAAKQAEAKQAEMRASHEMEMAKIQAKFQADNQLQQFKHQSAMKQEYADHKNKMEQEMTEHRNEMQKLKAEFLTDAKLVLENMRADLKVEQAQSAYAIEEQTVEHGYNMTEMGAQHGANIKEKLTDAEMAARQQDRQDDTSGPSGS